MLIEVANKTRSKIKIKTAERVLEKLLIKYKLTAKTVSLVFIGDQKMRQLNKQWRHKDKPTDILSFAASPEDLDFLGELIIDWQQIKRQASRWNHNDKQEMVFIIVHGFLHLLGHSDDTDQESKVMLALGDKLISQLALNDL